MIRKVALNNTTVQQATVVSVRCPHCGHEGSFENVGIHDIIGLNFVESQNKGYRLGIRRCPRTECNGQLFYEMFDEEVVTYPAQRIDFDVSDIPKRVANCLVEAIDCHANGDDIAAAIMVRKTLEEMCDHQNATGKDLKDRIKNLGSKIVIPQQLIAGMDALRLLGNDAAHIEARVFSEVGSKELEVAIKFTKELLKNTYQYASLLKELEDLKKP